jgi:hypothetical protein
MGSQARRSFDANCQDIDKLLQVHRELTGTKPGRRYAVEVLNKSGIVLLTSFWEAYCEDVAAEALERLVSDSPDATALPIALQKLIAKELKADPHELAIWQLADDRWRTTLQARLIQLQESRNRKLNTPNAENIDDLFRSAVGIEKISSSWYWSGMSAVQARGKLGKLIELRGEVAHRGQAAAGVRKTDVRSYYTHIKYLVGKTGGRVNSTVKKATGRGLW